MSTSAATGLGWVEEASLEPVRSVGAVMPGRWRVVDGLATRSVVRFSAVSAPGTETAIIVGAGPIGLACAISASRRGLDPLVIDAGAVAESIVRYPIGMVFFTTPERLEIGGHPLVTSGAKPTREEALKYYRGVARAEQLRVRPYTRLVAGTRHDGRLDLELATRHGTEHLLADRLVTAAG